MCVPVFVNFVQPEYYLLGVFKTSVFYKHVSETLRSETRWDWDLPAFPNMETKTETLIGQDRGIFRDFDMLSCISVILLSYYFKCWQRVFGINSSLFYHWYLMLTFFGEWCHDIDMVLYDMV